MSSSSLEVPRRQQPAKRARLWRILAVVGAVLLAVAWLVWFLRTPDDLPVSSRTISDGGVVDQPLYVPMFAVGDDFDRTLHISKVAVDVHADGDVAVEPKVCPGQSIIVTTDVSAFDCDLEDPDGVDFSDGDSLILVVTASEPTDVTIDRLQISFREGIRWGAKEAGIKSVSLTFADHTPGTVEDSPESDEGPSQRPGQNDQGTTKHKKKDRKDHPA